MPAASSSVQQHKGEVQTRVVRLLLQQLKETSRHLNTKSVMNLGAYLQYAVLRRQRGWAVGDCSRHALRLEHGVQQMRVSRNVVMQTSAHLVGEGGGLDGRGGILQAMIRSNHASSGGVGERADVWQVGSRVRTGGQMAGRC